MIKKGPRASMTMIIMLFAFSVFAEQNASMTLLEAIKTRDIATFNKVIEKPEIDVNVRDKDGNTPLHWAAKRKLNEVVKPLLDRKADPNLLIPDKKVSPLGIAVFHDNRDMVAMLLDAGANPNIHTFQGRTALIVAASLGHDVVVGMLLAKGADINAQNDQGNTALMIAASNGKNKTVEMLLAHQADPTIKNSDGKTALDLAGDNGKENVVKILTECLKQKK